MLTEPGSHLILMVDESSTGRRHLVGHQPDPRFRVWRNVAERGLVKGLSPRQREAREREDHILEAARDILLDKGFHGLTMDKVAQETEYPKGTMYQRFGCKEDIVVTLAQRSWQDRLGLMQRGAAFDGRPRERMTAVGEAVALYSRLNPDDSRIMHMATGPIVEKASQERMAAIARLELEAMNLVRGILIDAVAQGDLTVSEPGIIDQFAFGLWALVDGSYTLIEGGTHSRVLSLQQPFAQIWLVYNVLADGYGWEPLFAQWDYEETLVRVRKGVFPEEAQALYGKGAWHGDGN